MCQAVQGGSREVVEKSTIFIRKIGNKPPKAKLGRGLMKTLKEDRIGCAGLYREEVGRWWRNQLSSLEKLGIGLPKQSWEGV